MQGILNLYFHRVCVWCFQCISYVYGIRRRHHLPLYNNVMHYVTDYNATVYKLRTKSFVNSKEKRGRKVVVLEKERHFYTLKNFVQK